MVYAISTLIFNNPSYIVGACISFFLHKKFIEKYKLNIKLVAMVDNKIHQYKKILELFFDEIIKINLDIIKIDYNKIKNEHGVKKYINWVKYSINKWQVFNLDSYKKVLFVDVDLLPINKNFYKIFENNTPSVLIDIIHDNNTIIDPQFISNKKIFEKSDYNTSKNLINSINATLLLIKPDKKLYSEYLKFLKICEGDNGYDSFHADETTLLYFLMFYKSLDIYSISKYYASYFREYDPKKSVGLNYPYKIKSWEKLPMLQRVEENIWHIIAKKVMVQSVELTHLYIKLLLDNLIYFANNYKIINKNYNIECIQNKNIFIETNKLLNFIKNKKIINLSESDLKKIFYEAEQIHKLMNKNSIINIKNILYIIK